MSRPKKRPPNKSTIKTIKRYWLSDEGQDRLKEIDQRLDLNISVRVNEALTDDRSLCWACLKPKSRLQRCHIIPDFCEGSPKADNLILMCYGCHLDSPTMNHPDPIWIWMNERPLWRDEVDRFIGKFIAQSRLSQEGIEQVLWNPPDGAYPGATGISPSAIYSIWVVIGIRLEEARPDLIRPEP
jgi:hypothetical protein